jgi:hypothetical protein
MTNITTITDITAKDADLAALQAGKGKVFRLMNDTDIAATLQTALDYLKDQPTPVNTKEAFVGYSVKLPATKMVAEAGLDDVHMLAGLQDTTLGLYAALEKALAGTGWYIICKAGSLNRAKATLSDFEFRYTIEWKIDIEEAIALVLAGDEAFESTDDDDDEAYDVHCERLSAAVSIVYDYLMKLTTKWTARDVKLARIYIKRLAEFHEQDCKPRDFIPHIEILTELNEALLRGLEAAAA